MKWIVLILLLITRAQADLANTFGFGAVSAGFSGADRAKTYDGFAVTKNPALMSFDDKGQLSLGIMGAFEKFDSIKDVVIDNANIGGTSTQVGNVDTDVPDVLNFLLGSIWKIGNSPLEPRIGVSVSTPIEKLMEPTTKDIYQPQYSMYLSDNQRLTFALGASFKLHPRISFGAGANYYLVQGATLRSRFPQKDPDNKTSFQNMKMSIRPVLAPIIGLIWNITDDQFISLNYSGARDARLSMRAENIIGISSSSSIPLVFNANASLYYDPDVYSFGYAINYGRHEVLIAIDYERWSGFDGAIMKLEFESLSGSFQQTALNTKHIDIITRRLGYAFPLGETTVGRIGLAYRPSPVPTQTDETNFLDSDRFIASLGASFKFDNFIGLNDAPIRLDCFAQGHSLTPKHITKTNSTSIGAPGYDIKGYVFAYGLTVSFGI